MFKEIIKYIKNKRNKELEEYQRQKYIQKRVMKAEREYYKNRIIESTENKKKYFFDSEVYGKIFN